METNVEIMGLIIFLSLVGIGIYIFFECLHISVYGKPINSQQSNFIVDTILINGLEINSIDSSILIVPYNVSLLHSLGTFYIAKTPMSLLFPYHVNGYGSVLKYSRLHRRIIQLFDEATQREQTRSNTGGGLMIYE